MALLMALISCIINVVDFHRLTRPENIKQIVVRSLDPIRLIMAEGSANDARLTDALQQIHDRLTSLEDYDFMGNLYRITVSSTPKARLTLSRVGKDAIRVGDLDPNEEPATSLRIDGADLPGSAILTVGFQAEFSFAREAKNDFFWVIGAWPIILVSSVAIGFLCGSAASGYIVSRLGVMNPVIERWRAGDFSPRIETPPGDELTRHSEHLNAMADDLSAYVALRNYVAVREERDRVARDLHDTVKQRLFALALQIATIKTRAAQDLDHHANIEEAEKIVRDAQHDVTNLLDQMHGNAEFDNKLGTVVATIAEDFSRRFGLPIQQSIEEAGTWGRAQTDEITKMLQECLTNVVKHSAAKQAEVRLCQSRGTAQLVVRDDGRGFDPSVMTRGLGLRSIATRAKLLPGGRCDISTRTGEGCEIAISWTIEETANVS
jgi:NarL family two-component system sensor histidine kinase LiaS